MSILFDRGPTIELGDFRLLRDLVNRFCGIEFSDDQRASVARKLRERLRALDLADFKQYYHYLRYHADAQSELERAAELLTTNETYFFREDYQLRGFRDEILPNLYESLADKRTNRLAIWSAGCSTGEEVYTLAMLIAKSGLFDDWNVRVFGNDISRRVLHTARRAVYGSSSFRAMPEEFASYFMDMPEGRQVHPRIRAMCHFGHLNLLERERTAVVGRVDAIFCRNVLIYFDERSRRSVIDTFYERLSPGGYLMLGHSESLLNLTTAFELVHLKTDLVYRKPDTVRIRQVPDSVVASDGTRAPNGTGGSAGTRVPTGTVVTGGTAPTAGVGVSNGAAVSAGSDDLRRSALADPDEEHT